MLLCVTHGLARCPYIVPTHQPYQSLSAPSGVGAASHGQPDLNGGTRVLMIHQQGPVGEEM